MPQKTVFTRPLRASHHCRHYSYVRREPYAPVGTGGPTCDRGVDLSAPGASANCMPSGNATGYCDLREEYTEEERRVWNEWQTASFQRLVDAIAAIPAPAPLNAAGHVTCPNCGGTLRWARWERGAGIQCETEGCTGPARFNIAPGADWPVGA